MDDPAVLPPPREIASDMVKRSSSPSSNQSSSKTAHRQQRNGSKTSSVSSHKRDPSLTSFPSLSSEHATTEQDVATVPPQQELTRTASQKIRDRKRQLASLTSASGSFQGRSSLFDESPRSSLDIPGSLHLANDDHIERLIAKRGAVKLIRQFAQDLAQRDAELSALRARADDRERELKKMLREARVSSSDIERSLQMLENSKSQESSPGGEFQQRTSRIDDMMYQAMVDAVGNGEMPKGLELDGLATVRASKSAEFRSGNAIANPGGAENKVGSGYSWQFWNSNASSRETSRHSSVVEPELDETSGTTKASKKTSHTRQKRLENVLQPSISSSYFIGGANNPIKKTAAADTISVSSQKSGRSMAGWTKLFGGSGAQTAKEDVGRVRSSSLEQGESPGTGVSRFRTNLAGLGVSKSNASSTTNLQAKGLRSAGWRTPTASHFSTSPEHVRNPTNSSNPTELEQIVPEDSKPPTMTTHNNFQAEGLLTDRFGFIFDQRQKKRQILAASKRDRLSGVESLGSFRIEDSDGEDDLDGTLSPGQRPTSPALEDGEPKKWTDFLVPKALSRPAELLAYMNPGVAVVTVNTAQAEGNITPPTSFVRGSSISVNSKQALPTESHVSAPSESSLTASASTTSSGPQQISDEPVKLLLERLTGIHDGLQQQRLAKWNDFLRRVRADNQSSNTPEANLENGELIGSLGNPKKRNAFKALVLGGIPVALRPKIWLELSSATLLRIPGYYDDLVHRSQTDMDPETAQQLAADIGRTLTDNTFFRFGNGKARLEEVLKAYSLHNPRVGYCQGMNLITASLLLICATSEDVFWLLVAIVDKIMPSGYFDRGLRVSRADQSVLRQYVHDFLPRLDNKLDELGVELEICTFPWYLSLFSAVVSAEPLYRIWDVILTLNSSETPMMEGPGGSVATAPDEPGTPNTDIAPEGHDGTGSSFMFQLSLALLKLNETAVLGLGSAAEVYQYVNNNM